MSRLAKTLDDENRFFSLLGRACDDEDDFQRAVEDTFWLTYRCGFPALSPYAFTDDAGWGCMLRSAQMMMANALRRHLDAGPAAGEGPETRRRRGHPSSFSTSPRASWGSRAPPLAVLRRADIRNIKNK
mmetsp:Transcript_26712/g.82173  ORF Transcript_26712/g.82173 Transcript_26712/m.82173 type:complete len:129 (+) Transcript_26712:653-1039(+)